MTATDTGARNTLQTLLNHAKKIIDNQEYAGVGIELVEEMYEKYSYLYTVGANGIHTVNRSSTIAQLSPAIENLYRVVNGALIEIDALSQ